MTETKGEVAPSQQEELTSLKDSISLLWPKMDEDERARLEREYLG